MSLSRPSQSTDLAQLQQEVDRWIRNNGGYWDPMSMLARLVEEVGELAREYNHRFGAKRPKADDPDRAVADELGDLLFILVSMANERGVDLGTALDATLRKYDRRDAGRWQ